jgi:hypothetical protein
MSTTSVVKPIWQTYDSQVYKERQIFAREKLILRTLADNILQSVLKRRKTAVLR